MTKADRIEKIEKQLDVMAEQDLHDDPQYDELLEKLEELDPWNDLFHLGCPSWPVCEEVGCGEW